MVERLDLGQLGLSQVDYRLLLRNAQMGGTIAKLFAGAATLQVQLKQPMVVFTVPRREDSVRDRYPYTI
jgi:hypothetical protein